MYYEILVDGESIGTFGHPDVENMHLSVGAGKDGCYIFASAVCNEDGKQFHYDWLQQADADRVQM